MPGRQGVEAAVLDGHARPIARPVEKDLDLCALALGRPCRRILSTRILLVDYPALDGRACALGMIAENVTETRTFDPGALEPPPLSVPDAPYLGPMLKDGEGVIQVVELSRLLPASLQETLFSEAGAVT